MSSFSTGRFLIIVSGITIVFVACLAIRRYEVRKDAPEAILARADDLSWKKRKNFTPIHGEVRIKLYNEQAFDYEMHSIDLTY